jgi:sulfonate transport system permease protein
MAKLSSHLKSSTLFLLLLVLWYILSQMGLWSSFVLPGPGKVADAFREMCKSGELLTSLWVSVRRILIGFSLASLLAFCFAIISLLFPGCRPYYSGLLNFLRNVPPLTLIPLLILWFGIGEVPKVIVIILASFFPLLLNLDSGFAGCDTKLLEVGKVLGFTKKETLKKIVFPYALPYIVVGMRIALGYSLRAIIGAEMIAASSGLGYLILDAETMSRSDKVLVGIIVIGLLGICLDYAFALFIKQHFPYSKEVAS